MAMKLPGMLHIAKTMNCLLIDPVAHTVESVTPESIDAMAALIGMTAEQTPEATPLRPGEYLLTNPGLQVKPNPHRYFRLNGHEFAGRGLALTHLSTDELSKFLTWFEQDAHDQTQG